MLFGYSMFNRLSTAPLVTFLLLYSVPFKITKTQIIVHRTVRTDLNRHFHREALQRLINQSGICDMVHLKRRADELIRGTDLSGRYIQTDRPVSELRLLLSSWKTR